MEMERLRLGPAPAIAVHPRGAGHGAVLLYHPLGADKTLLSAELDALARAGLHALGVDAIAHGERRPKDAWERFRADPLGALLAVVTATAEEVPEVVEAVIARGWAPGGRVGIGGISLGGFVAYGAAVRDRRLVAAACLNASPEWGEDPRSPHLHADRLYPVALLSVTAAEDARVPPGAARAFHAALAPRYAAAPERLRYVELAGEGHRMSAAGQARARDEAVRWLVGHLAPP
jgi:uncharacterized protein